jgi:hypothetical protein
LPPRRAELSPDRGAAVRLPTPCLRHPPTRQRGSTGARRLSRGFVVPSALESSGVHSGSARKPLRPRRCLPLRSVLAVSTTSTVCSAIRSCPGFPAQRSWDSTAPIGLSRLARVPPSPAFPPLLALSDGPASGSRSRLHHPMHLQGFAPCRGPKPATESTVVASSWFPACWDPSPMGVLGGTVTVAAPSPERADRARRLCGTFRSRHVFRL